MPEFWFQYSSYIAKTPSELINLYYKNIETLMMTDLILIIFKSWYGIRCYAKGMGRRFFSQFFMWSGVYYITNTIKYCMILISLSIGTEGRIKS